MDAITPRGTLLLVMPFVLIPGAMLLFRGLSTWLGKEAGYVVGFLLYWGLWCVVVPLIYLGRDSFTSLFRDSTALFSRANWAAAVLFAIITVVTLLMYGKGFVQAPAWLILIAIPVAIINGVCEELLWRGLYLRAFPGNLWLAILFPAVGFAFWHLAPLQVFSEGNKMGFVLSTLFLGLAYGWIAYRTGSARWSAISHSLNGILALGGAIAPAVLALLSRL